MRFILFVCVLCGSAAAEDVLPRKAVDRLALPAIDGQWTVGMVVGLINEHDRQVIGYGKLSTDDPTVPDGRSVYEIGSITKTFTATLLADAAIRGEVQLDDPLQRYLPPDAKAPTGDGGKLISLLHLSTHSSGLPRMPGDFFPGDWTDPYADYSIEKLDGYLTMLRLQHDPGERCLYSNMGVALLGQALAHRANEPYETLLLERVIRPLGLKDTKIALDDSMRKRLAPPFDVDQNRLKSWDLNAFSPAGGIKSTADDLLSYVSAELALTRTDLAAAIELTQKPEREFDSHNDVGLNWLINKADGHCWHNRQTGGYHAAIDFDRKKKLGVVVLTNSNAGVADDIADRLLRQMLGFPVEPPTLRQAVALDPALLDRYVGSYKISALAWLTVARVKDHLTARVTGQSAYRIYPQSETEFFWKVVDARLTFEIGKDGKIASMVLHQNGAEIKGERK